jgi:hypothetical protein
LQALDAAKGRRHQNPASDVHLPDGGARREIGMKNGTTNVVTATTAKGSQPWWMW